MQPGVARVWSRLSSKVSGGDCTGSDQGTTNSLYRFSTSHEKYFVKSVLVSDRRHDHKVNPLRLRGGTMKEETK